MRNRVWIYIVFALVTASCGEDMVQTSSTSKEEGHAKQDTIVRGDESNIMPETHDSAEVMEAEKMLTGLTSNNVRFEYVKVSDKEKIQEGDVFKFHYVLNDSKGNEIRSSKERVEPFALKQGLELMPKAVDLALPGLCTNSKVNLIVATSHPDIEKFPEMNHKEGDSLIYTLEIKEKIKPINSGASNVYKLELGKGAKVEQGDIIGIDYFGFTPDGKVFMTSREAGASYEFPVGRGRVIPGLDSAFTKLNIGDKVIVEVPAKHAYGSKGLLDKVKPNTDLTYLITIDYKK